MKFPSILRFFPAVTALAGYCLTLPLSAETVAEWKFDGPEQGGDSTVSLDASRSGASKESALKPASAIVAGETGLSNKWKSSLAKGYLEAKNISGLEASLNQNGLVTKSDQSNPKNGFYPAYFGFSDLGNGTWGDGTLKGGTVYLVLSPEAIFKQGSKYGIMGSGHAADGGVQLSITKNGELRFTVGGKTVGEASTLIKHDWAPDAWYFIAASWRANSEPMLYVREMASAGPSASPEAMVGTASGPAPASGGFDGSPLVIGAGWYDPGANAGTVYGAGSKIAYARFDNTYSTKEEIEAVFKTLGAP